MRIRNTLITATALSAVALVAGATAASASITVNPGGSGFIGKGNVQTALGYNNKNLQDAVDGKNGLSLVFTGIQSTSQALSQEGTQDGTQAGTQSVSQDVTCTMENGIKTFHRDGERLASRDADRDADRTGTRTGTRTSTFNYSLDVDARKGQTQYTGFILKGSTVTSSTPNVDVLDGPWVYGTWSYGTWVGDESTTEWGDWIAAPGDNPAECLGGSPNVTDLVNTITAGTPEPSGDATPEGEVAPGEITTDGPVVTSPFSMFVNGKPLV
jgi:hypothetical protein